MGYTWTPGDALSAANLNKMNQTTEDAIAVNTHNIVELYLQQYFDGKNPNYNGLFFDGWSDTSKADTTINTTLTAAASATDTTIDVGAFDSAELNKEFRLEGASATEVVVATATAAIENSVFADTFDRADSTTVGNGWTEYNSWSGNIEEEIATNAFQLRKINDTNGGVSGAIRRSGTKHTGVTIKADVVINSVASPSRSDFNILNFIGTGSDDYWGMGIGVAIDRAGSTSNYGHTANAVNIVIYSGGYERAWVAFTTGMATSDNWGTDADPYKVECEVKAGSIDVYVWRSSGSKPTTPTLSWTGTPATSGTNYKILTEFYNGTSGMKSRTLDFSIVEQAQRLTLASGLSNAYSSGDSAKRTPITIDTANKKLTLASGKTAQEYHSKTQNFQQSMSSARLWLTRNWTARYNPSTTPSGTTVRITGDKTGQLATGDTVDIYTTDNITRERRTISAIDYNTTNTGETTITLNSALTGTYTTSDYIERVDAIPQLSLVASGASESFGNLTYVRSEVDFSNNEVEDEYTYTPSTAGNDLTAKVTLTRNDTTLSPYAKRLGVSLTS